MTISPPAGQLDRRRSVILQMSEKTVEMLELTREAFLRQDRQPLGAAERLGREVHRFEKGLMAALAAEAVPSARSPTDEEAIFLPMHLERVGDNIEALAGATRKMITDGVLFTDRATREIGNLFEIAIELLECLRDALRTSNRTLIRHILEAGRRCESMANEFARFHEARLIEGVCLPRSSSVYLAMLDYLKGVEWHARQIAEKLEPPSHDADAGQVGERHLKPA